MFLVIIGDLTVTLFTFCTCFLDFEIYLLNFLHYQPDFFHTCTSVTCLGVWRKIFSFIFFLDITFSRQATVLEFLTPHHWNFHFLWFSLPTNIPSLVIYLISRTSQIMLWHFIYSNKQKNSLQSLVFLISAKAYSV